MSTQDSPEQDVASPDASGPGTRAWLYTAVGSGACAGQELGSVIDAVPRTDPAVADILDADNVLTGRERPDGTVIVFAFATPEGFRLILHRGWRCESGCIDNEYFFFETDDSCMPQQVGYFKAVADGLCWHVEGEPLWNYIIPVDPEDHCA